MTSTDSVDSAPQTADGSRPPAADRALRFVLAAVLAFLTLAVFVVAPLLAIACSTCQDGVRNLAFPGLLTVLNRYVVPVVGVVSVLGVCTARRSGAAAAAGGGALTALGVLIVLVGQFPA